MQMGGWQFTFIQHKEAGEIEFSQYIAPVIDALREMGVNAAFADEAGSNLTDEDKQRYACCCGAANCRGTMLASLKRK